MSRVFMHDGSFGGFLCATAELLNARIVDPQAETRVGRGRGRGEALFDEEVVVRRDDERARRLWERVSSRCSEKALLAVVHAFCSDIDAADEAAARVLSRLWFEGDAVLDDLSDPDSRMIEKAATRTRRESHLMTGLIRFAELRDGSLYATIEPSCDILALIGDHFAARFPAERWAIGDVRRGTAILHQPGMNWVLGEGFRISDGDSSVYAGDTVADLPFSINELEIRRQWVEYFRRIAIEGRINPRLQASFMPMKHWKHLPEMNYAGKECIGG